MGPAAAWNALNDPTIAEVLLCDRDPAALEAGRRQIAGQPGAEKLTEELPVSDSFPLAVTFARPPAELVGYLAGGVSWK